ncbi:hypothetical protein ABW20_dc0107196 [Dactylellina cionopaga]|nr:hypothetical protein ABW20_dc0107196 [Dactylellina cionopaga]
MVVLCKEDYDVGWLCALPLEITAATIVLDSRNATPEGFGVGDPVSDNHYIFGSIGGHNIVITALPYGIYGTTSAANVVNDFKTDFPNLRFRFLVGVGGATTVGTDIRLGDVVVSTPTGTSPGVIQYDLGKVVEDESFIRVGALAKPPQNLLRTLPSLRGLCPKQLGLCIFSILEKASSDSSDYRFSQPGGLNDMLFVANYTHHQSQKREHRGTQSCRSCDPNFTESRGFRPSANDLDLALIGCSLRDLLGFPEWPSKVLEGRITIPFVHFGTIASGNQIIKDEVSRDKIQQQTGALCIEMEASGVMDSWPCLVIRGICDSTDSHKNEHWQPYAAATDAASTKCPPTQTPSSGNLILNNKHTLFLHLQPVL